MREQPGEQRLPWEMVEVLPSTDRSTIERWRTAVETAVGERAAVRSRVGLALALYWAVQEGIEDDFDAVAARRRRLIDEAVARARAIGDPTTLAVALLGDLHANWGPDALLSRRTVIDELCALRPLVEGDELRHRIDEWPVIDAFDRGDIDEASRLVAAFERSVAEVDLVLFYRRAELWRANLAMLTGAIDRSLSLNERAVAGTATTAGTPFSFQNAAITVAIERFLRRRLGDIVESVRSIRASSPRVSPNWTVGLAFSLAESGDVAGARDLYEPLAAQGFREVPRDLNWLVTMHLVGLVALTLDDRSRFDVILDLLRPFGHLDATHGSGYASYGPMGRVLGSLAAAAGRYDEAERHFEHVLRTRRGDPWTALTILDRAIARATTSPAAAITDARAARQALEALGLDSWAARAAELATELERGGHGGPVAIRSGGTWELRHPAGSASIDDSVGVRHLLALLTRPGHAVDVVELDVSPDLVDAGSLVESPLDDAARRSYRRRLDEIEGCGSLTAAEEEEAAFLRRELASAAFSRSAEPEVERARVRVTKALRRCIDRIGEQSPVLADHLAITVDTGRRCMYSPADGRAWRVVR